MKMQTHTLGEGPLLGLVGGGLTGWKSWESFQIELAGDRKVVRLQPLSVQLGLEGNPLPADYSVELEAAALGSALSDFGDESVDLAAWSYGATIALAHAFSHPERVRTLTLIEPAGEWALRSIGELDSDLDAELEPLRQMYAEMAAGVSEEQLARFIHLVGFCPPDEDPRNLPAWPVWTEHRQSLRFGQASNAYRVEPETLRGLEIPVMLLTGEGTTPLLRRTAEVLAEWLPRARLLEWSGGHAVHIVNQERFIAELNSFLLSS